MKYLIGRWLFSVLLVLFSTHSNAGLADINRIYQTTPQLNHFETCQGGGCVIVKSMFLEQAEWDNVQRLFTPLAVSASDERQLIAKSIGLIEDVIGRKTGTTADKAGTFNHGGLHGQQDCNDEAINTTTYMRLMKQAGWIRFHEIEDTGTRGYFFNGWPHSSAVIREIKTSELFAVDSWFYDNGHPAEIVPFAVWKDGYIPKDSPLSRE